MRLDTHATAQLGTLGTTTRCDRKPGESRLNTAEPDRLGRRLMIRAIVIIKTELPSSPSMNGSMVRVVESKL